VIKEIKQCPFMNISAENVAQRRNILSGPKKTNRYPVNSVEAQRWKRYFLLPLYLLKPLTGHRGKPVAAGKNAVQHQLRDPVVKVKVISPGSSYLSGEENRN
jgi:hypothetical protein